MTALICVISQIVKMTTYTRVSNRNKVVEYKLMQDN